MKSSREILENRVELIIQIFVINKRDKETTKKF